jgi:sulfoxide reductase heme-binding subunit YedZ
MNDASDHIFWITSRAAGICALVLASLAVTAGLAIAMRAPIVRGRSAQLRTLHEALSIGALGALAVHGLALLGDSYLSPSLLDLAVPFSIAYRPIWTALGIVAAYGLAGLSLSYYARSRIGVARWRSLHRFIAVFWLLGVVHTLGAGTDAGQTWFLVLCALVVLPPLTLLATRLGRSSSEPSRPPRPQPGLTPEPGPATEVRGGAMSR